MIELKDQTEKIDCEYNIYDSMFVHKNVNMIGMKVENIKQDPGER